MRTTVRYFQKQKESGQPITMLTAYDATSARIAESAGIKTLLVGDSLGMCVYGYTSTVPVTMDQCIVYSELVRRGAPNTFIIGDMPLGSYQISDDVVVEN